MYINSTNLNNVSINNRPDNVSNIIKSDIKDSKNLMNSLNLIEDKVDLSMDYSKDIIISLLDNINAYFYGNVDNDNHNFLLLDTAKLYFSILNKINSSPDLKEKERSQLTKILNNSFENFTKSVSNKIGDTISNFLNKANNIEQMFRKNGIDIGIFGEKIINTGDFEKNIAKMFEAIKIFYENNHNSEESELKQFFINNFSNTESIENLSYNDFIALQKAVNVVIRGSTLINQSNSFYMNNEIQNEVNNIALNVLMELEASYVIVDAFNMAIKQNKDADGKVSAYEILKKKYEKILKELITERNFEDDQLKKSKKEQHEILKKLKKLIKKIKENINENSVQNEDNSQFELLEKQYNTRIDAFSNEQQKIKNCIDDISKKLDNADTEYNEFLKNPAGYINDYLISSNRGI